MMKPLETPESLRERWKSGIWKETLDAILAEAARTTRKISAEFLRSLNIPECEARLDLRGIPFFEPLDPRAHGHDKCPLRLYGDEYRDIDFSHAIMRFYLGNTKLTNLLFCDAILENCDIWDCEISRCSFNNAFMPWLGIARGTRIVNSVFDHSKIRHYAIVRGYASFEGCSFLKLDWRMINFSRCLFENCVFSGHLQKAHADSSSGHGLHAIIDYYSKLRYKGYNVFKDCSFDKLMVTRFSIEDGSLTLQNCTGFPTFYLPSKEFRSDRDFYSDNTKPKMIL